ncbi:MAG: class I SAM-dependent methyltransferase [Crocinitomicaceae bacterium]
MSDKKAHWEKIYRTKDDYEVSWYQEVPKESLELVASLNLDKVNSKIIDIGGGNSNFTAELLNQEYTDITLLDISQKALDRTKAKIGNKRVDYICSDVLEFQPIKNYTLWHDRAAFHFITDKGEIQKYIELVCNSIDKGGYLILATFSTSGPLKCSGLEITQYSKEALTNLFKKDFDLKQSFETVHQTPFDTEQNFIYSVFEKR